jgi:hypothetical protein
MTEVLTIGLDFRVFKNTSYPDILIIKVQHLQEMMHQWRLSVHDPEMTAGWNRIPKKRPRSVLIRIWAVHCIIPAIHAQQLVTPSGRQ